MNRITVSGNLATDVEFKELNGNGKSTSVCSFRVAVRRRFKNQQGTYDSDFFPVTCWGKLAEICRDYLAKGRKVIVEGALQTRSYKASDGTDRYITEIVADNVENISPREGGSSAGNGSDNGNRRASAPVGNSGFEEIGEEDDLPF